jgi:glycosyltransferase involved in cell wall biosynthesis
MKLVLFINNLAGGGAERVTATLANYWARKQWDVTIVTLGPQNLDFYPLEPSVGRVVLNLAGDSGNLLAALRQNVRRVMALRRTIRHLRPQVALSMMSTPNVLLAFACLGIADLCAIGSERCYPPHFPLGTIWHALRRRMYGRLAAVVALTQESADWIRTHSAARCVPVIPNPASWPLPDNLPRIAPDGLCTPARRMLLTVGRLSTEKNFDMLIDVFSRLAPSHPEWDLVILGEGPERQALEARIRDAGSGVRILMPGIAGNVGAWYARADLYVTSSRFEGFPNALAEALAHGLPAVSFDCDTGPRDIIRHGIDGLLVPPDDIDKLQAALNRMMHDQQTRQAFAARAVEARERFSMERIAARWEALFLELSAAKVTAASASEQAADKPATERCAP